MNNTVKDFIFGDGITMNNLFRQFSMGAVAMAVMQVANAQVSITNIVPMQIPGQGTEIRVMFNGLPPQPAAYQLEQPSRLVLDFDKAQQSLKQASIPVATREASSVDVSSDAQRARLTVNLAEAGAFTTRVEGNTFILKINSTQAAATPVAVQQTAQGVSNIGFQRGAEGEGQVVIDLAGSNTPVDVQQQGSKIIVRTLGNKIPAHLARRLNVNDFATPVSTIDAQNDGGNGVITIQSAGSYEYMAYQAENKLTISLKRPVDKNPFKPRAAQSYTGKKISLDFQDIEVRRVLQLLADFTGINMVAADTVQGNITLRLKDVPWDQALDIILKTKNLDKRRNGNVIWIAPVAELLKAEEEEAKAIAQSVKLAPLQTEYIQLNYAKAADIEKLITDGKNASNSRGGTNSGSGTDPLGDSVGSLLSPRGTVSVDPRTNTLIINDTAQKIDQIRGMIDLLDVSVKQVMIEARIVEATTGITKDMGVKWGILSQGITNNNHLLVGGSDTTLWNLREPEKDDDTGGWKYEIERPQNLNVDLGASVDKAARIAFGLISLSDFMLDLELSALEADGQAEVVSTPKVLTADKKQAVITYGEDIPYQTVSQDGTQTTMFSANLKLDVTPNITPDGKVAMELIVNNDTLGALTAAGYRINRNEVKTNILVDNGETIVLGGIYKESKSNAEKKVPFLGDIPFVGNLFKNTSRNNQKAELLIFVTPRIVNDSVSRNH
ncbi:type IV pilus secretin PilQ [Acinetobacter indicus]|uniref:type IV pilus secretin PilQ n=1 Tax=Acinetobacter indicus TaxID=756892 RepID=UPI000CEBD755|nr:type IV pilus secretin PilQ family protein [Acinetobacter indicus]MCO8102103.1 type IV pilus secretin PilQ family protein [Acinetobacter indicus]